MEINNYLLSIPLHEIKCYVEKSSSFNRVGNYANPHYTQVAIVAYFIIIVHYNT